jgi:hypothetical protein
MRANVKPLVHWAIYKGYTVRYHDRTPQRVTGVLTGPEGSFAFEYEPATLRITLPESRVHINEHGWEIEPDSEHDDASAGPDQTDA